METIRMPSEGKRFELLNSVYEVSKSKGRRIACQLVKGQPLVVRSNKMPVFTLFDTKFRIIKIYEKRIIAIAA